MKKRAVILIGVIASILIVLLICLLCKYKHGYYAQMVPFKGKLEPSIYSTKENPDVAYLYSTDGKSVYYKMAYSDAKSFVPIENGKYQHFYAKDKRYVYYLGTIIEGADPDTFSILWHTVPEGCSLGTYSKDKNHVYYKSVPVQGADLATFEPLLNEYGKDKNRVYLRGQVLAEGAIKDLKCHYAE